MEVLGYQVMAIIKNSYVDFSIKLIMDYNLQLKEKLKEDKFECGFAKSKEEYLYYYKVLGLSFNKECELLFSKITKSDVNLLNIVSSNEPSKKTMSISKEEEKSLFA